MQKTAWILAVLVTLAVSESAFGYRVRCNSAQSLCEVDTKRLTTGDKVAIFNDDQDLVALGRVKGLKGRMRVIKILKRYGPILYDHELTMIEDREFASPEKFFRIYKKPPERAFGGQVGLTSLGVGEGFMALTAEGFMEWDWKRGWYVVGRGFFLSGSGEAASVEDELVTESLSVMAFAGMGGLAYTLLQSKSLSLRTEADLGLTYVSASVGGGYDVKDFIEGRVVPGVGIIAKAEASVLARFGDKRPFLSAYFLRLQNSTNYGVAAGLLWPL